MTHVDSVSFVFLIFIRHQVGPNDMQDHAGETSLTPFPFILNRK
jgi:hypothetical protein